LIRVDDLSLPVSDRFKPFPEEVLFEGSKKVVSFLLQELFFCACAFGGLELVRKHLQVFEEDKEKVDPFFARTEPSLEKSELINRKVGKDQISPLFAACREGYMDIVFELLRQPEIKPDETSFQGKTPLIAATEKGYLNIVSALIQLGSVDTQQEYNNRSAASIAAEKDFSDIFRVIMHDREKVFRAILSQPNPLFSSILKEVDLKLIDCFQEEISGLQSLRLLSPSYTTTARNIFNLFIRNQFPRKWYKG